MVDLTVHLGPLTLKNPVLTASGTFGYGTEYGACYDVSQLGGIVTKMITLNPREGNPMPRIAETPGGMLNSIGLANVGSEVFLEKKLPQLEALDTTVIVNVAGSTIEEYGLVVERLTPQRRIDAFEINISCPNVKKGGLAFGTDPENTLRIVRLVREKTDKPVIVKLTPNVTNIVNIARAAQEGGADMLSLINTVLGMRVNIESRKPLLARKVGGLSGPAIKPIALARVYQVAREINLPLIGIGGIMRWQDVVEFMLVGASAVQIGTLNFVDPLGGVRIAEGLGSFCEARGIDRVEKLVGCVEDE